MELLNQRNAGSLILIRRRLRTLSRMLSSWMDDGSTLYRVARKAERGKLTSSDRIPQWQLVNRKWTRHTPQFPAIFASGHTWASSLRSASLFLRSGRIKSLLVFWRSLSVEIKEVRAARIFATKERRPRWEIQKSSQLSTIFDHFFCRIWIQAENRKDMYL